MFFWHANIFVRLLIPFLLGILLALSGIIEFQVSVWLLVVLLSLFFLQNFVFGKYVKYSTSWQYAIFPNLIFFFLGLYLTLHYVNDSLPPDMSDVKLVALGSVSSPVKETEKHYRFFCDLQLPGKEKTKVKILVYVKKSEHDTLSFDFGDLFLFQGTLRNIRNVWNPGTFDYARYLRDRFVYYQVFIDPGNLKLLGKKSIGSIADLALLGRDKVLYVLQKYIPDKQVLAIVSAIFLGYDEWLDPDVKGVFAASGAMHILCVSGLHVGIIYFMFSFLLSFLKHSNRRRVVKNILLILIIAAYALLTGLSPSVLRASLMLIVIITGQILGRKISIYNLLAFSAFLLLLFNPLFIREIGFQLSYMAVLGIVIIYPRLNQLYISRYALVNKIWALTIVSMAAVLFTFPLAIYYFHQFPTYFLLTNLLVIPVATGIIYAVIFLLVFSWIPFIATWIGSALVLLVGAMFQMLDSLIEVPGALISAIHIHEGIVALIYFVIFAFIAALLFARYRGILWGVSLLVLLVLFQLKEEMQRSTQKKIIFYAIPSFGVDVIKGREACFVGDSVDFVSKKNEKYLFYPMETYFGITRHTLFSSIEEDKLVYDHPFIIAGDIRILLWDFTLPCTVPFPIDYMYVDNPLKKKEIETLLAISPRNIVLGYKVPEFAIKKLQKALKNTKIVLYSLKKQGALLVDY
jgi:competence protein ComEC